MRIFINKKANCVTILTKFVKMRMILVALKYSDKMYNALQWFEIY